MKFLLSFLLIAVLSFIACIYFPWWSITLVALSAMVLVPQKPLSAFFAGFFALFILWSSLAYYISMKNDHILAHKVSLLILKSDSPVSLVLLTGLIGGIVAGLAALAGSFLRKVP